MPKPSPRCVARQAPPSARLGPAALTLLGVIALVGCPAGGGVRSPSTPDVPPNHGATDALEGGAAKREETDHASSSPQAQNFDPGLVDRVAKARGLPFLQVPTLLVLSRTDLVERATRLMTHETCSSCPTAHSELLTRLELAPVGFDLQAAVAHSFRTRLHGLYDPTQGIIAVDAALTPAAVERVLVHELVHALQAQHFDLAGQLRTRAASSDSSDALLALAEGDATVLTQRLLGTTPVRSATSATAEPSLPDVLGRSLSARYEEGTRFVQRRVDESGFEGVNAVWSAPPTSMRQVLHDKAPPQAGGTGTLAGVIAPAAAWRLVATDTLGEQALVDVLGQWTSSEEAHTAARARIDDSLYLFENDTGRALSWRILHDTAAHAHNSLEHVARGLFPLLVHGQDARLRRGSQAATVPRGRAGGRDLCRSHRDTGVVAALTRGCTLWFVSLRGEANANATCEGVDKWINEQP